MARYQRYSVRAQQRIMRQMAKHLPKPPIDTAQDAQMRVAQGYINACAEGRGSCHYFRFRLTPDFWDDSPIERDAWVRHEAGEYAWFLPGDWILLDYKEEQEESYLGIQFILLTMRLVPVDAAASLIQAYRIVREAHS